MNDFFSVGRWHNVPVPLGLLWFHELPVVLKHKMRARMSELQRERACIVKSRKVIRSVTMTQTILRPFFDLCGFSSGIEELAVIRWCYAPR